MPEINGVDSLEGSDSKFELPIFCKDGQYLWYSAYIQPSNNKHSEEIYSMVDGFNFL